MDSNSTPSASVRLAVLLSGGGTTLINLHEQIQSGLLPAEIVTVIASRDCKGVERSANLGYSPQVLARKGYPSDEQYSDDIFATCDAAGVELVILAGFLSRLVIPDRYMGRVMNIHPSLIPAFCGQGMFGHHVHAAVVKRGCKVSGCTVHFCDNEYDHGPIILQKVVEVLPDDDADAVAERVFAAECEAYPEAIRRFVDGELESVISAMQSRP